MELNKNKVGGMFLVDVEKKKRVIILGAGVTGLSAGIRLLKSNCDVCILEKSDHSGGLAKTIVRGEYRLDIGPHHLFSQSEEILQETLNSQSDIPLLDVVPATSDQSDVPSLPDQ